MTCPGPVGASLERDSHSDILVRRCEPWSWEELHDYLQRRTDVKWSHIPQDVRDTLRRPLLSRIYADELFQSEWIPTHEYQLYERVWQNLSTGKQSQYPLDVLYVQELARSLLVGAPYPWSIHQCKEAGLNDSSLARLEQCGWLGRTAGGRYRVFHDRLLNWAVAQSLFAAARDRRLTPAEVTEQIAEIVRDERRTFTVFLGYVPMDFLWLSAGDLTLDEQFVPSLLAALEEDDHRYSEFLYEELVPTLGPRIARPLFLRLQVFKGYPWILHRLLDALAKVGADRIPEYAKTLLDSSDTQLQRRGMKLLTRAPCPALLDRLWQLHCQGKLDPTPWLEEHEQDWQLHEDSFGALKKAAFGQADWIVRTIAAADGKSTPVHDVGWIVALQDDLGATWHRCKRQLFEKVAPDKPRVLATLIGRFRDREEIGWLQTQLHNDTDSVGAVALRSLARIDPDLGVERMVEVDAFELRVTQSWSLREVLHRRQNQFIELVEDHLRHTADPWRFALALSEHVGFLSSESLSILLDALTAKLNAKSQSTEHRDCFFHEFRFLAGIHAPYLLDEIRRRRGTDFEQSILEYLLNQGPQRGLCRNSLSRTSCLALLRTIGGTGFPRVINEFLTCDDRFGRLEAIDWSPRLCDSETYLLLTRAAQSTVTWDDRHPLEQNHAMEGLAIQTRWADVVSGLLRWGISCSFDLTDQRLAPPDLSDDDLAALRAAVQVEATPCNVLALGFCGNPTDPQIIHGVLETAISDPDLAQACVSALRLLRDTSEVGVQFAASQLRIRQCHFSSLRMLTEVGTATAWAALLEDLKRNFDHIIALNLINLSDFADDALALTLEVLPTLPTFFEEDRVSFLARKIRSPEHKQRFLSNRWLREKLHRDATASEGSFWVVGSKASAIRALAEFDPKAAFDAARRALETEAWHDRERFPAIVLTLDQDRAIPVLFQRLCVERSRLVRYSIGLALAEADIESLVIHHVDSPNANERTAACFLAGFSREGHPFHEYLLAAMDDPDEEVLRAAMESLERQRVRTICSALRQRAMESTTTTDQWLYLDHLVEQVDPGLLGSDWPDDFNNLCADLSPLAWKRLWKRLEERRKKLVDALKK